MQWNFYKIRTIKTNKKYRPDFPDDHKNKKKTKTLDIFADIRYNIIKESIPIGGRSHKLLYEITAYVWEQGRLFPFIIMKNHVQ